MPETLYTNKPLSSDQAGAQQSKILDGSAAPASLGGLYKHDTLNQPQEELGTMELSRLRIGSREREIKFNSIASRVYGIVDKMNRDPQFRLSDKDRADIHLIADNIDVLIDEELDVCQRVIAEIESLTIDDTRTDSDSKKHAAEQLREKNISKHKALGRYITKIFDEDEKRAKGGAPEKVPDIQEVKKEVAFDPITFQADLESKIKGLKEGSTKFLALLDQTQTSLIATYPLKREGDSRNLSDDEQAKRVATDATSLRSLISSLQEYADDQFPIDVKTMDVAQRRRQIEKQLVWMRRLLEQLDTVKAALDGKIDANKVDDWKKNSNTGLGRAEFYQILSAKTNAQAYASFTDISEYAAAINTLKTRQSRLLANNGKEIAAVLDELRKKGLSGGQARLSQEAAEIKRIYIDEVNTLILELEKKALEYWKTKHLEEKSLTTIRTIEKFVPGKIDGLKSKHADLQTEIGLLEANKNILLNLLPNSSAIRNAGEAHLNSLLDGFKRILATLVTSQYEKWESTMLQDVVTAAETVRSSGETVAASGDDAAVDAALTELSKSDAALNDSLANFRLHMIDNTKEEDAKGKLDAQKKLNQEVRDKLNARKKENADSAVGAAVKDKEDTLHDAVTRIIIEDDSRLNEMLLNDLMRIYYEPLRQAEIDARTARIPIENDPSFGTAKAKIEKYKEMAEIREMSFAEVVRVVRKNRYDVFKSESTLGSISDAYEREMIKKFQKIYYAPSETQPSPEEHRRLKTEMWAFRYTVEHDDGKYVPAAAVTDSSGEDILYASMKGRALVREDILAVTQRPGYEQVSKDMLEHGIKVIAGEIKVNGLNYGALAANENGQTEMGNYLKAKYVDSGLLPEDQFNVLWDLFVSFDLASIGLVRAQKGTMTRSHNSGKKVDTEFLSYPFQVMSHTRNRYGKLDTASQHLLLFVGEYPQEREVPSNPSSKYLWAGNESHIGTEHIRTVEDTRELVTAFMRGYMPLNGIEHSILTSGTDGEWSQAIFPDHLAFLTARSELRGRDYLDEMARAETGTMDGYPYAVPSTDLYNIAQDGWKRMLEMTVKSVSSGLSVHDVFKDGGIYEKFINEGIGKAKMVKGKHLKLFVPMLRSLVGRISVAFASDVLAERIKLRDQFIEQLTAASSPGKGLDIAEIKPEIDAFINELRRGVNRLGPAWRGIPEILTPYDNHRRRQERIEYMQLWWKDQVKGAVPAPNPERTRAPGTLLIRDARMKVLTDTYYDAIEERIQLPQVIDRSAFTTDTSSGDKK